MSFKSGIATGSIERDQFFLMLQFGENLEGGGGTELGILERIDLTARSFATSTAFRLLLIGHLKTCGKSKQSNLERVLYCSRRVSIADFQIRPSRRN